MGVGVRLKIRQKRLVVIQGKDGEVLSWGYGCEDEVLSQNL